MSFEIVPPGTRIDFIGKRRVAAALSLGLILASLIAIPIRGVRLGIDFAGGNEVQVRFAEGVAVDEGQIREVLSSTEVVSDPTVMRFGTGETQEYLIKFLSDEGSAAGLSGEEVVMAEGAGNPVMPGKADQAQQLESALREGIGPLEVQRVEFVGPRVGAELQSDGLLSLFWASLAILAYVAFRFSSRFAPGAVVAVIHDLLVTAGIFIMLGLEFDLRILAAMLAILGYSLNDTIIIYDRIRENLETHTKAKLPEVLNLSVNQTLSRTVLTSGTTLLALLSLFFLGGDVIRPFAFAMLIGVLVGTYSSIYIASPLLLLLEARAEAKS
ncbi:MAG: protein translocase subunit SecF [bacterium TMED88]|nr:protein translocase subunit SecF [Deltaproteobacteria bacterium]OUV27913.1 MAG: protein translocase subunit SecF [bacterium TMED88]